MNEEAMIIALTIIGLLGSLAATMIAIFFRFGSFKGVVETKMDHLFEQAQEFRNENNDAHAEIYNKVIDHHARISALEVGRRHVK